MVQVYVADDPGWDTSPETVILPVIPHFEITYIDLQRTDNSAER
ncbi:hypothetical protein PUR22_17025 [Mycolicibacterium porcinum]